MCVTNFHSSQMHSFSFSRYFDLFRSLSLFLFPFSDPRIIYKEHRIRCFAIYSRKFPYLIAFSMVNLFNFKELPLIRLSIIYMTILIIRVLFLFFVQIDAFHADFLITCISMSPQYDAYHSLYWLPAYQATYVLCLICIKLQCLPNNETQRKR